MHGAEAELPLRRNCPSCPAAAPAATSAIVRLEPDAATWTLQPEGTPVHLLALFRDPAIVDGRAVQTVLDLRVRGDGRLIAGQRCWVGTFLRALEGIPPGITIALDNGVRCPCAKAEGPLEFRRRAACCHLATAAWHSRLRHPDGQPPGIAVCDKDLAEALADSGTLRHRDGTAWRCPSRFLDAVGAEVKYLDIESLILAHPAVLQWQEVYRQAFIGRKLGHQVRELARLNLPRAE